MRKTFLALFLLLCFPAAFANVVVHESPVETSGHSDDAGSLDAGSSIYMKATLHRLRRAPGVALRKPVHFVLQYKDTVADWNPYLSRFGPENWIGIQGWSDDRYTWDKRVFDDPGDRLFVRKGSAAAQVLRVAQPYQRFEIRGIVREIFLGEPWIEIESATLLPKLVGEGTILHVGRADTLLEDGRVELAIDQLERAKSAPLPANARKELERRIVECHRLVEKQESSKNESR